MMFRSLLLTYRQMTKAKTGATDIDITDTTRRDPKTA
jgi:hypothetical protein